MTDNEATVVADGGSRVREVFDRLRTKPLTWVVIGPALVYLILVAAGITNANIGVDTLRVDADAAHGDQLGISQAIRSDEYGTESPIWLGELARAGADAVTPLSVSNDFFAQLPDGPVSAIVFFDGSALSLSPWIAEASLFAAKWWLPTLLLFIGMPIWFRQLTGTYRWGYLAAFLVFLAPANMWWSGRPVNTIGFVVAGCALAIWGADLLARRRTAPIVGGLAAILIAGILLARTPTYYQPLAIIVGIPIVAATAGYLIMRPGRLRDHLIALGAIIVSGGLWTGLLFAENIEAVTAGLSTVYPGDRASSGGFVNLGQVFGSTNLGWLATVGGTASVNQTEVVSSFTVFIPVLAILFASQRWMGARALTGAFVPLLGLAIFWLSWATVSWGGLGAYLPLINRVPPARAAEAVGFIATIAFALFMSQWKPPTRQAPAIMAAAMTALLSGYAGSALQAEIMPDLRTWMIWLSAAGAAAAVYVVVRWPGRLWSMSVMTGLALLLTIHSTPILIGLGDLRGNATADAFMEWGQEARESGTVWASDTGSLDSLMLATGVPSLSTRQQIGPDREAWLALDPGGVHEDMWNRGGLHIQFDWTDDPDLVFSQPYPDTVVITGSPCTVAERVPTLSHIASSTPLDLSCTAEIAEVRWSSTDFFVYEIVPTP
ncbi:hypothetical protein GCM10009808_02550 [Microbacterium sediminicola]|uniref:4-amino-4-deoxy-L-arabinose transferase n=1 Tax=Microbacterium sediminicola TaxID=415210 RepID=A0ABN2HJR6_9MICO